MEISFHLLYNKKEYKFRQKAGSNLKQTTPWEDCRAAISLTGKLHEWMDSVVFALIVVMIFNIGFRIVNVNGSSMFPTLFTGDRLIIAHIGYQPQVGDIIVSVQDNKENEPVIKRIVALEGQTVDIDFKKGIVYVDGQPTDDSYTNQPGIIYPLHELNEPIEFPCTVPKDSVFVMGDNRNFSLDSRSERIGMIEERYILGKAIFRLMPFERLGTVK